MPLKVQAPNQYVMPVISSPIGTKKAAALFWQPLDFRAVDED